MLWKLFGSLSGMAALVCVAIPFVTGSKLNPLPANAVGIEQRLKVPADIQGLLRRSCFDCHSNETRWPLYSRVWPMSSLVEADVKNGRKTMNFSEWPSFEQHREARRAAGLLLAACAAIQAKEMPLRPYLAMHPEAKFTAGEQSRFCAWTTSQAAAMESELHNGHGISEHRPDDVANGGDPTRATAGEAAR